ncbi:MBL fold metallo-hydrolase [candidate division KSB1 bacterium]|nr:MBL fold metallo-hydrolase [candidate division KSB1 bacterium]
MILEKIVVGPMQVNCYIIGCEQTRQAAVIDPGDEEEYILQKCRQLSLSVERILLTHGHVDHIGAVNGLQKTTGAKISIHRGDEFLISLASTQASFFNLRDPGEIVIDRYLNEGQTITLGKITLRVIFTPGHSPGGVCFLYNGYLLSGDTLFCESIGRTDLPGGSTQQLLASIKTKLLILNDDICVLPGHGPQTEIGYERLNNPFFVEGLY